MLLLALSIIKILQFLFQCTIHTFKISKSTFSAPKKEEEEEEEEDQRRPKRGKTEELMRQEANHRFDDFVGPLCTNLRQARSQQLSRYNQYSVDTKDEGSQSELGGDTS